jgi:proteic killer suppression protein
VEYEDDDLRRLAEDASFTQKRWGRDVVRAYRKKIQILLSSMDERDLRNVKSLRLEKLRGDREGQRSIQIQNRRRPTRHCCRNCGLPLMEERGT